MNDSNQGRGPREQSPLKRALFAVRDLTAKLERLENARREPIAVVGIGCRFPGGGETPEEFWELLDEGRDAVREVPPDRWDIDAWYDPDPAAPGKMYARSGGFIDRPDLFDSRFFGIVPREAVAMDPQQRLLLESSWRALEHAGIAPASLRGGTTGVYVGISNTDYAFLRRSVAPGRPPDIYSGTGNALSIAAGRLSYTLGLQGPCLAVDTACSASLVAVHLAVQALRAGQCDAALAGGVNVILNPEGTVVACKGQMLAPDGKCKAFDRKADGFVRGEGCGMLVLKRLSDARAAGDRVLAILLGTAINQDGASSGLTVPNGAAQVAVVRAALADAGVEPRDLGYFEAHGTGTSLGDPIEMRALANVFGKDRERADALQVGSVKTNVGHLESAAGIAGLIKTVLAIDRRRIPPHRNLDEPSPHIPWSEIPIEVPTEGRPWAERLVAGVSSFGFSGTNANVIVGAAPETVAAPDPVAMPEPDAAADRPPFLLPLSARSGEALATLAGRWRDAVEGLDASQLGAACRTAAVGRNHFRLRGTALGTDADELRRQLERVVERAAAASADGDEGDARPRIAFLFTGQGAQYVGMGRGLYASEPVFRDALNRSAETLAPYLERPLPDVLYPDEARADEAAALLDRTGFTQPALFALELALARLWLHWGVEPVALLGHSVGEYAAACIAGVMSDEDGARLIAERARRMQELPEGGAMAAVFAGEERVRSAIEDRRDALDVAAINGPENVVISGAEGALDEVLERLAAEGVKAKRLTVSHAFHSPLMDPMLDGFGAIADALEYREPRYRLMSNVTGGLAEPGGDGDPARPGYWRRHVRGAVRFADAMQGLARLGCNAFVEIGPSPTLLGMGGRSVDLPDAVWAPSLRRNREDRRSLLGAVASIYEAGAEIDWNAFCGPGPRATRSLPGYPFERKRYWIAAEGATSADPGVVATPADGLYTLAWEPAAEPAPRAEPFVLSERHWLLFADAAGISERVAARLAEAGAGCTRVRPGAGSPPGAEGGARVDAASVDAFERLITDAPAGPLELVYAWSLDTAFGVDSLETLRRAHAASVAGLLHLLQAAERSGRPARLWLVTRAACGGAGWTQAPLFGVAASMAMEQPGRFHAAIDLGGESIEEDADRLWDELRSGAPHAFVSIIEDGPRTPRMVPAPLTESAEPFAVRRDGAWLITGGHGALGRRTARLLVDRGARRVVLASRGAPADDVADEIASLRAAGAEVESVRLDVSDPEAVDALVERLASAPGGLAGVVHAAGALDDGALSGLTVERFRNVFAAKVDGAWNLHRATADVELDAFVLFSSVAGVTGAAGQANYAAANAFLDALATARAEQALPALSIAWGPWAQAGMAAEQRVAARLRRGPLQPIEPDDGAAMLERALTSNLTRVVALRGDVGRLAREVPGRWAGDLLARVAAPAPVPAPAAEAVAEQAVAGPADATAGPPPPGAPAAEVESWLRRRVARIIDLDPASIGPRDDLIDVGLDSLMVMELVNAIREDFDVTLFAREIFDRPTLRQLAEHVAGERGGVPGGAGPAVARRLAPDSTTVVAPLPADAAAPREEPVVDEPGRNPTAVFLISSPRSGSTLLRVMLAGHPDLFCPPELHLLVERGMRAWREALGTSGLDQGVLRAWMELTGADADEARGEIDRWVEEGRTTRQAYAALQERAAPRLLVDKSPTYGNDPRVLDRAEAWFDGPRYLFLVRHPYSVIESFVRNRMDRLGGAEAGDPSALAESIWSATHRNMLALLRKVGPERALLVRYEDLVRNPDLESRRILAFLGLEFDPAVLQPYEGRRMTDGIHASSVGIGDPNFLRHRTIDPKLADVWETIDLGRPLGAEAIGLAEQLGYALPRESAAPSADAPAGRAEDASIPRIDRSRNLPLSFTQQRLWFIEQLDPGRPVYNMRAFVLRLRGMLNADALRRALDSLVSRHEALRTTIDSRGEAPVQRIAEVDRAPFETIDAPDEAAAIEAAREAVNRPFDVEAGPLFRAMLIRIAADDHVLALPMHHLVSDGWSMGVIARELKELFDADVEGRAHRLPSLPLQFADWAAWQRRRLESGPELARLLAYWRERVGENPEPLQLPADRPRPSRQTNTGSRSWFEWPPELNRGIKELARRAGATPFMTLLAAFQCVLFRYTGRTRLLVGTPVANRGRPGLERVVGFFANTLVLRLDMDGSEEFLDLVERVRDATLGAFDHQELPFEKLVEELQPDRDLSHHPLFQVLFSLQDARLQPPQLAGLDVEAVPVPQKTAHFDLTLYLTEHEGGLRGAFEYSTDLFDEATIVRLQEHLRTLVEDACADGARAVDDLALLPPAERERLIRWNATDREYADADRPVHGLFEKQASRTPEHPALRCAGRTWSYAELDAWANRLARRLLEEGIEPETCVGVAMERSAEMVVSLLAVLKAGGAYVPLDPDLPPDRLQAMIEDARTPVVLTQERLTAKLPTGSARTLAVDAAEERARVEAQDPTRPDVDVEPDRLAYTIFTSGSTGRPKGAMNEHRGVVNRLLWMQEAFELGEQDRVLQKTPYSFDVSVWEFFWPLATGACLVVAPPGAHRDPAALSELIAEDGITTIHFVPSMLQAFVEAVGDRAARCASLRRVICSGEALPPDLVRRWYAAFGAPLFNLYGPTEAAVDVTWWPCPEDPEVVPIGRPIANTQIHVLDRAMRPTPIGVPGELWIGGVQVGRGYLARKDLTDERFVPDPFRDDPAKLYRSGDLARWRADGTVEYLGRLDFQVKIRGFRIELGEIETVLSDHPAVRECVVATREERAGDPRLVAWYVSMVGAAPPDSELRNWLADRLPEYMIPARFVALDSMPLNPSGKVDRNALPDPIPEVPVERYVEPETELERLIAGIWGDLLDVRRVGRDDSFFDLGGHSLLATRVVSQLRDAAGVEIPLRALFEASTVRTLAARIERERRADAPKRSAPRPIRRDERLPLSFAQQRLWYLEQLEPGGNAFSMPGGIRIEGPLDVPALERALGTALERHESLRTRFGEEGGEPYQVVDPAEPFRLRVVDLGDVPGSDRDDAARRILNEEAATPFDLATGPLFRVRLLRLDPRTHVLVLNMHHIVSDGWSLGVLLRELGESYRSHAAGEAPNLPALPVQYVDYAAWQREWLQGDVLESQLAWWRSELNGAPGALQLPTDRPRPPVESHRGDRLPVEIPGPLADAVHRLARAEGATLFMTLLAAFATLLHRYSRQDDVCIGSPIANRNQASIERLVGFFANMLVLRARFEGNPSFRDLLRRLRESTLGAYDRQDLPFERLVEELQPARDMSLHPLFQAMLILQNAPRTRDLFPGLATSPIQSDRGAAQVDLALYLLEREDGLGGGLEYATDLFDEATVARMMEHFLRVLEAVVADPEIPVQAIPLLSEDERDELVFELNRTDVEFPRRERLHDAFEARAAERPDGIAIEFEGETRTYRQLDERANRVARVLRDRGVVADTPVGVHLERSPDMVVALLGVLKAGGAYVPLDPAFPRDRLEFMLEDSGAPVIVTQASLLDEAPGAGTDGIEAIVLERDAAAIDAASPEQPEPLARSTDRAYVIYTSGSTGKPKGVQIPHRAAVNFLRSMIREPGLDERDTLLSVTTLSFDISVLEIFGPLSVGARLALVSRETAADGMQLMAALSSSGATVLQATPITWRLLLEAGWPGDGRLKALCGGEALTRDLADALVDRCASVWNMYGPTETTVWSAVDRVEHGEGPVPVGPPIDNTRFYVVDADLEPVPRGVAGELLIGGDGLAIGYLNRPELTADRFRPDPFRDEPGARIYRTGDLVRYRADGRLEFLGRIDHQIKIRGFRVELGEIESVLASHPSVREVAVVVREDRPGDARLIAYLVPDGPPPGDDALREHLRASLPDYMVPAIFVHLELMPLTPNNKIDRKALPAPEGATAGAPEYVAPRTPMETLLADAWSRALGVERVGMADNFFDLGGHSLLSMKVIAEVEKRAGVRIRPGELIYQTLEQVAAQCAANAPARSGLSGAEVPRRDGAGRRAGDGPGDGAGEDGSEAGTLRRLFSRLTGGRS